MVLSVGKAVLVVVLCGCQAVFPLRDDKPTDASPIDGPVDSPLCAASATCFTSAGSNPITCAPIAVATCAPEPLRFCDCNESGVVVFPNQADPARNADIIHANVAGLSLFASMENLNGGEFDCASLAKTCGIDPVICPSPAGTNDTIYRGTVLGGPGVHRVKIWDDQQCTGTALLEVVVDFR